MSERTVTKVYDGWAHVEPSTYTVERKYDQGMRSRTGSWTPPEWVGTMYAHPTVNGGSHRVWVWRDGSKFEYWVASNGATVGGPRAL
jgi:hypothetical protein